MSRKIFNLGLKNIKSRTCGGRPRARASQGQGTAPIGARPARNSLIYKDFLFYFSFHYISMIGA